MTPILMIDHPARKEHNEVGSQSNFNKVWPLAGMRSSSV